jgi:Nickel responsive protein SCO4226-like
MPETAASEYVVECYWPDVQDVDLQALDERAAAVAAELSAAGGDIRYLGSMLMRADEVVLCLFAGHEAAVREAAERASIPFERILESARSPWPKVATP